MKKATIHGGVFAATLGLFALIAAAGLRAPARDTGPAGMFGPDEMSGPAAPRASAASPSAAVRPAVAQAHGDLLHGRVTTVEGEVYEGRLRFGGDEEALWGSYFNSYKAKNPWVDRTPDEDLPRQGFSLELFGVEFAVRPPSELGRPFMARFGDIRRIEARGRDLRVTLRSGTLVHLDRWAADDFADGVRVWDDRRGIVHLEERQVRAIDFLSGPAPDVDSSSDPGPLPLYGTVRTRDGDFTGFVEWDRVGYLGPDPLRGRTADGDVSVPFEAVRSIARRSGETALVTLIDGREIALSGTDRLTVSGTQRVGPGSRGMYVDDARYGRVLVSWDAFARVDFGDGGPGPTYDDFQPGRPLAGTVVTRSGRHLSGRLVYDLDESETTETLDAPAHGVDYTIPLALVASIEPRPDGPGAQHARVILQSGEELELERSGDLGEGNAGMLIFVDGAETPEYVPWDQVERIHLDARAEM